MSGFTIKVRGGGMTLREYRCPEHGVFEVMVPSGTGDTYKCPAVDTVTMQCSVGGRVTPSIETVSCGALGERCFTVAPLGRVKLGEVRRGKSAGPPSKYALDTRPLADGMPLAEFRAKRRALRNERRQSELKARAG